ncbi:MAG: UDP-N-acetylmuramoyl-L-alanyl-D-glutamate--2,6-diaminopimelate ligase [Silvanigrellaceae bacterium]|nr:UDP-N-acetylmuramoyl-L-alanyl-D-glutamate--2,6-diaminopimelate ligase [Silvanigrellaceae bacterium]
MNTDKDFFFEVDASRVLLLLETNYLLTSAVCETSSLRRFCKADGTSLKVKILYNSKNVEEFLKEEVKSKKPFFVYFARKGQHFDGHSLAEKVLSSGNIFVGNSDDLKHYAEQKNYPQEWSKAIAEHPFFLSVNNVEYALKLVLKTTAQLSEDSFLSIAVTGTNGKTSTTQITSQIIETLLPKLVLKIGTLGIQIGKETMPGSHVTTPDYPTFLSCLKSAYEKNIRHVVFEASSHGLKENRMGDWLVDIAIFTNLTQDHLDYHKTFEDYRNSKQLLFTNHLKREGTAVLSTNNQEWISFATKAALPTRHVIGVGSPQNKQSFFKQVSGKFKSTRYLAYYDLNLSKQGISGIFQLENEEKVISHSAYCAPLLGQFQHENLACSVAACIAMDFLLPSVTSTLPCLTTISGRLEKVEPCEEKKSHKPLVIVDHAHSPDALEKSLCSCKELLQKNGKLFCVFGCGGDRDKMKRPTMGKIAVTFSDLAFVTSDNPRSEDGAKIIDEILSGIDDKTKVVSVIDRKEAITLAIHRATDNDIVLIAGKGSEKYQIIGTEKLPFSDYDVAKTALDNKL